MKTLNNRHIRHASICDVKKYASNACYYNYAQRLAGALKYLNTHYIIIVQLSGHRGRVGLRWRGR